MLTSLVASRNLEIHFCQDQSFTRHIFRTSLDSFDCLLHVLVVHSNILLSNMGPRLSHTAISSIHPNSSSFRPRYRQYISWHWFGASCLSRFHLRRGSYLAYLNSSFLHACLVRHVSVGDTRLSARIVASNTKCW